MPNADITTILTESELKALRKGFDNAGMVAAARAALNARLPRAAPMINANLDLFFPDDYGKRPGELGAANREIVIMSLLAAKRSWDMAGIHIYWGLAQGPVSPAEIGETLMLAASYLGVDTLSEGLSTASKIFNILKSAVAAGYTKSSEIVPFLLGAPIPQPAAAATPAAPAASAKESAKEPAAAEKPETKGKSKSKAKKSK